MKIGHVEVKVRKYRDGRWGFDDYSHGKRKMVRLLSKQKAQARATDVAVLLANGRYDLLQITAAELAEFRKWKAGCNSSINLAAACASFLAIKQTKSSRHVRSLRSDLALFEEFMGATRPLGDITALDVQRFLDARDVGDRRKFNLRIAVISLFRWARRMSYLPERTTEAERVEPIEKVPGKANVLTPDQMRTLLDNVQPQFFPWLCIAAFSGIRSEEIAPDPKSKKSPLKWEDFDWKHRVIIVRGETAKTGEERETIIPPNLAEWIAPYRNAKGPVIGDAEQPSKRETGRLGQFIGGGWKHNCLRDSFCSYRTRITKNQAQTALEMGSSVALIKRSYHRRQPIRAARQWFNIRPVKNAKVISFSKQYANK
jgi:integrase